jgi:hypothetical protein
MEKDASQTAPPKIALPFRPEIPASSQTPFPVFTRLRRLIPLLGWKIISVEGDGTRRGL